MSLSCALCLTVLAAAPSAQLVADFTASPTAGVNPLSVSFADLTTGLGLSPSWVWDFGDGNGSFEQNPTHSYTGPGSYTVQLSVLSFPGGFDSEVKNAYISVSPAPLVVDFSVSPLQGVNPVAVSFTDTSTGAITAWSWDFGDGSSSTEQHPTHIYSLPGSHSVSLTASVGQQSDTLLLVGLISVDAAPLVAAFSAAPTQGDSPLAVTFSDTSTGAITAWDWDFGDGNSSTEQNPAHTYTLVGTHSVSLTAFIGQQGDTIVQTNLITVTPTPVIASFSAVPSQGESPLAVTFTNTSTGPWDGFSWDFGDPFDPSGGSLNPKHVYAVPGTYSVSLTVFVFGGPQTDTQVQTDLVSVSHGQFSAPKIITTAADGARSIDAADLDGDGDLDLLSASQLDDTIAWYENSDGQGGFGSPQIITAAADGAIWVDAADLDGDADIDVLSASQIGGTVAWYENVNGLGTFAGPLVIEADAVGTSSVHAADLDGDGDTDVLTWLPSFTLAWYENVDGLGSFGPPQTLQGLNVSSSLSAPDLDGDGDADVLAAASNTVSWWENEDGLGSFGAQQVIASDSVIVSAIAAHAADFDGDGDLDVLSGFLDQDGDPGKIVWNENVPAPGLFGPDHIIAQETGKLSSLFPADLDGDGDIDVLASFSLTGTIVRYENLDGLGNFGPQVLISAEAWSAFSVHAADLDGDLDLDVFSASYSDDTVEWFENGSEPTWLFLGGSVAGSSGVPLLTGTGDLSAGELLTLDLTSALPGGSSALVMGFSSLGAAFKGGVLVPSPDLIVAGLPIDASGDFVLGTTWPAGVPAGLTIWFQHWISDPSAALGLAASNGLSGTTSP